MSTFKPVSPQVNFPELEEQMLEYWKKNKIFEKSIESRPLDKTWTILDGPPFITGMPHYGTLLSSLPKDVFPRYFTMKGYRVRRVWGWDCHGLPAENKVETQLGLTSKREIEEKVGVKTFIDECKRYVSEVSSEWEWYVQHIGRWVDFKNAYKTMDMSYMETVMWVFKQMYDKGYIYKGLRVSLYCPHCATPISNFEVAMDADNYKETTDHGTTYKYKLKNEENIFILAWSTTPWNKIVTPALAVNPNLDYVKVEQGEEQYILAKSTLGILDGEYKVIEELKGQELVGLEFEPHYNYYPIEKGKKAFEIIPGDFVTAEEGTGVVTIAAYGEEDLKAMLEHNIHIEMHVDEEGTIKETVPLFGGLYYLKANKLVNEDLQKRGLIYKDVEYIHKIPLCWRCHTRLYYAPQNAWYVDIQTLKPLLKKTNETINWTPSHFKYGRFLKSLENAPDWNISRSRYWGSPVPVWECSTQGCEERFVPGSIKELEDASGQKITELHKPEIDEIHTTCKKCGGQTKRVPEVLDSWIEAGSASFAERHFPFEGAEKLEEFFPPDFIAEYTGQIRAWFYVLHVIGGALYGTNAFKNVLVEGVILGTDGRKMSKNFGNYPDPKEMLQKYGGDALRLYLLGSPVMTGEDILISEEQYHSQVKGTMLVLWNTYNFFITYALIDNWDSRVKIQDSRFKSENILDRWILSMLQQLVKGVTNDLENYNTVDAIAKFRKFVDDFSKWYIRRSRDRVGPIVKDLDDKNAAYRTMFLALSTLCRLMAPCIPFMTDAIYTNLTGHESVHLEEFPRVEQQYIDEQLEKEMGQGITLASAIHSFRKEANIRVRIPLKELSYTGPKKLTEEVEKIVLEEVNIHKLTYSGDSTEFTISGDTSEENQDLLMGYARDIIRKIQEERKKLGTKVDERVNVSLQDYPHELEQYIKDHALIHTLTRGQEFAVSKI